MSESKSTPTNTSDDAELASTQLKDTLGRCRMNTQMVQNLRLIWLDRNIADNNDDCRSIITQLRCIVNTIDTFTDTDRCVDFLSDVDNEDVCMIIYGDPDQNLISSIHDIAQLQTIFIFSKNKTRQSWSKSYFKIKDFCNEVASLCEAIKRVARQCEQNAISISSLSIDGNVSKKSLDHMDPSFMYTEIIKEILLSITFDENHIKQFSDYCREQFTGNDPELNKIKQFESRYYDETPVWWYTKEGFLYTMLNRSLRLMNTDAMIKMGFFIQDLQQHLEELHKTQLLDKHFADSFIVYRGQGMFRDEFEDIRKNKGGLLAFNNFLSTSTNRDVALSLAESNLDNSLLTGILFVMIIDSSQSTTAFASINDVTQFRDEDEILFSMQTVFRIGNITSIDDNPRLFQIELILTRDTDKDLRQLTHHIRQDICPKERGWYQLGIILYHMGQSNKSEPIYQMLLEQTTNESEKAPLYGQLGLAKANQGENQEAIRLFRKALEIQQKSLPPHHPNLVSSYDNMGMMYHKMGEYSKALSYYERALALKQQSLPLNHPDLVSSYDNMGMVYHNMGEYSKALSYYERSFALKQQSLPLNHPDLARSCIVLGVVYNDTAEYAESLSFFEKAVEIQRQSLPPNHPDLAMSYNNMGSVYVNMGEYSKALSYYERALALKQQSLPLNHPDLADSYNNIGLVYDKMNEYSKALPYYERSLAIQRQSLPPNHPDLAGSYNNMGIVYHKMGEYSKALSYYERSLAIQQQSLSLNHPDLVMSYNNIGLVYDKMNEYSKALPYYERSLEIQRQSLPPNHPNLAVTYGNLAALHVRIANYSTARSFCERALRVAQQSLPANHPDLKKYQNCFETLDKILK